MKTASPIEIIYTLAFALVLGYALKMSARAVRSVIRVVRYQRELAEPNDASVERAIAWDGAEQAVFLTGVVLALLVIGAVALFLPPNPAAPNSVIPGIAFLVAAGLIAAAIVRKGYWSSVIESEVSRQRNR